MGKERLVSVIIACYNGEKYINDCLESLVNQTYQNFEVIICDDASTDGSLRLLKEWARRDLRFRVLHNKVNKYASFSRNRCLAICKGEYIMIQDIDDVSASVRMETLVKAINQYNVDFVSSAVYCFQSDYRENLKVIYPRKKFPKKKDFLWNLPFHHPSTMFKRKCILSVNGYRVSEETRRGQDYDMFMRMYSSGYKGMNLGEPLYYYRIDAENIKRRTWKARKCEIKIRYKGFLALGLLPLGMIFIFKPIFAHIVQKLRYFKLE